MKKLLKKIIILSMCVGLLCITTVAEAKSISTLGATSKDNKITITGTAETGTLACVVTVYKKGDTEMLDMESFQVNADSSFSYTLDSSFADGTYTIKVADYDGGAFKEAEVKVETSVATSPKSAQTSDSKDMTKYVLVMLAGFLLIGVACIRICRRK